MSRRTYELYYWPGIPGRGEYVRLVLEAAEVAYVDYAKLPAKKGGGVRAMNEWLRGSHDGALPFAPPFLRVGDLVLAQTPLICDFLARELGLVPNEEGLRLAALQHALTIADLVTEAHDTHHPVGSHLYYEDQKSEAARRTEAFRAERMPKFLRYFEKILEREDGPHLVRELSYVDLSMFQTLEGLRYAFPNAFGRLTKKTPRLRALRDEIAGHPPIARYLASERRMPFNQQGIFRHYPELDPDEP